MSLIKRCPGINRERVCAALSLCVCVCMYHKIAVSVNLKTKN